MSDLPNGWAATTLGEIASWGSGGTPSRSNPSYFGGGIPWLKTGELGQRFVSSTDETISEAGLKNSSAKLFPTGAVAIAMYGATIGKTSILCIDAATNQACAVGIPNTKLTSKEYLYHYLCSQKEAFVEAGKGGAQPNISQSVIKDWEVPFAPRNEQTRIADKLDAVLARVDACRDRLNRIPSILKRFRQSVLAAATTGKLTEDWREDMKIAFDDWTEIPLDEVCIKITDGEHISPALTPSGAPLVSAKDVREWGVDFSDTKFVSAEFSGVSRRRCNPELDDVLVVSRGATVGRTCLITSDKEFCLMGSVLLFKPDVDMVNPRYLAAFLRSPLGLERLTGASGASAQSAIYIRDAKKLLISMPHKEEQTEIVRRVESLFACADRLEARYTAARTQVEKLTPSLLAKAFRGELVPQERSDEPASALLQRIRAQRGDKTTIKPKRGRKGTSV